MSLREDTSSETEEMNPETKEFLPFFISEVVLQYYLKKLEDQKHKKEKVV